MRLCARPVVGLDRNRKARMIEAFLTDGLGKMPRGKRILDIGFGNGDISGHFSSHNFVVGIDIQDSCRPEHKQLPRCVGRSESLPFPAKCFDIVISHHVIEHVENQNYHLSEIRRVLTDDGICYLGTPNMSSPFMRGHVGNPMVLRYTQMQPLLKENGFTVEECYLRWLHKPDRYYCETRLFRFFPVWFLYLLRTWFPSQCFLLRPQEGESSS